LARTSSFKFVSDEPNFVIDGSWGFLKNSAVSEPVGGDYHFLGNETIGDASIGRIAASPRFQGDAQK
jgi:hypothetical protein